jgi:peroxiredoxin/outer membrane lipoprotein-sorting protein
MKFSVVFLSVFLLAQGTSQYSLVGDWTNQNPQTNGITQITVRAENSRTLVHAWGACHPVDCDNGEAEAKFWNATAIADWNFGSIRNRLQLVPQPDGRLLVVDHMEFDRGSGPDHLDQAEFFARRVPRTISPEEAAARALLQQVSETYRTLPSSRFEYTQTFDHATAGSASRTVIHAVTLWSPPNKVRIENSSSGENSIVIADGHWEWTVYPDSNEYIKRPEGRDPPSFVQRYVLLGDSRDSARITGEDSPEGLACTVVAVTPKPGVTQELCIDKSTHLIVRDSWHEPASDSGGLTLDSETVYNVARTGVPVAPSEFSYDPQRTQAKNRVEVTRAAPESMLGKPAPDFALPDLDGRQIRLSALRGKPVLLEFWATWCKPCQNAMPVIEMIHRSLAGKGLVVLAVDDEPPEVSGPFLKRFGYTLDTLVDSRKEAANAYHVYGIPTLVLIDQAGKIVFYEIDFSSEKLRDVLCAQEVW